MDGTAIETQRTIRLRNAQVELDILKELSALQIPRYEKLKINVNAKKIQGWYRRSCGTKVETASKPLGAAQFPAIKPVEQTIMQPPSHVASTLNALSHAEGDDVDVARLESLRSRVQSNAILRGSMKNGYESLISATKAVTDAFGPSWIPQQTTDNVNLAVPSELQQQQAKLVELRQRSLQLLQSKYAREESNGSPEKVSTRRKQLTFDFSNKLKELTNEIPLHTIAPAPPENMTVAAAALYRHELLNLMSTDKCLQWGNGITEEHKDAAISRNAAALAALRVDRDWWHVYAPDRAVTRDMRETNQPFPWGDDVSAPIRRGEPGWRSIEARQSLPPPINLPVEPAVVPLSVSDSFRLPGSAAASDLLAGTPLFAAHQSLHTGPREPVLRPRDVNAAGQDSRVGLIDDMEASNWWISYTCVAPPKFAASLNSSSEAAHHQPTVAEMLSIPDAMARFAVVDPWSTAAARIDPLVASKEAREATVQQADPSPAGVDGLDVINPALLPTKPLDDFDLLAVDLQLATSPALDFFQPAQGLGHGPTVDRNVIRTAGQVVPTAAFARPVEPIASRVHQAKEALRRRLKDFDSLVDLPGNMRSMTQEVSARKIQQCWRGCRLVKAARADLNHRRQEHRAVSLQKLAVVQEAMMQFCKVLEHTAGVDLGIPDMRSATLQSSMAGTARQGAKTASLSSTAEPKEVDNAIGSLLATALSSVSRGTVRAATSILQGKAPTPHVPHPPPLGDSMPTRRDAKTTGVTTAHAAPRLRGYLSYTNVEGASLDSAVMKQEMSAAGLYSSAPSQLYPVEPSVPATIPTPALSSMPTFEPASIPASMPMPAVMPAVGRRRSRSSLFREQPTTDAPTGTAAPADATMAEGTHIRGDLKPLVAFLPAVDDVTPAQTQSDEKFTRQNSPAEFNSTFNTFGSGTLRQGFVLAVDPKMLLPSQPRYPTHE